MSSLIRHGTQYTAKGTLFTTKTTDTAFLWNAGFFSGRKPKGLPTTCGWPCVSTGHCPVLGCTQEHFTLMLVLFQFLSQTSLFQLEPVNVYIRHVWAEWAVVIAAWLFTDDLWCKDNSSLYVVVNSFDDFCFRLTKPIAKWHVFNRQAVPLQSKISPVFRTARGLCNRSHAIMSVVLFPAACIYSGLNGNTENDLPN